MARFAVAIKTTAAEIGGLPEFRKTGGSLSDFLDSRFDPRDSPEVIAAKILVYFCADSDGIFNNFMSGVKLAVGFLDRVMKPPPKGPERLQALKDLETVLNTSVDQAQLIKWARSWYR